MSPNATFRVLDGAIAVLDWAIGVLDWAISVLEPELCVLDEPIRVPEPAAMSPGAWGNVLAAEVGVLDRAGERGEPHMRRRPARTTGEVHDLCPRRLRSQPDSPVAAGQGDSDSDVASKARRT